MSGSNYWDDPYSLAKLDDDLYRAQIMVLHDYHLEYLIPAYKYNHEKYQAYLKKQRDKDFRDKAQKCKGLLAHKLPPEDEEFLNKVRNCLECQKYLHEDEGKKKND